MPLHVELIIFDFDGTLVNTGDDIANSVNYTLKALNLPLIEKGVILTFIGDGVVKLIERVIGNEGKDLRDVALKIFSEHYDRHMLDHAVIYPGVIKMLKHFSGKRKIILTNKRFRFTEKMVRDLGLSNHFVAIIGADSTPFIKPDPKLMDMIWQSFPSAAKNTVIIGDGVNDIKLAKNAGILCGCYLNGLGNRDELKALEPDFIFEHFDEMKNYLI